ncbi:MAG: glutamine amidotransferase [Planctomycetota bacterium]|nr:glutamine amidotransferase [Planctomycetota bacterium]
MTPTGRRLKQKWLLILTLGLPWLSHGEQARQIQLLKLSDWEGPQKEVAGLKARHRLAIAYPKTAIGELVYESSRPYPSGQYRLTLNLRSSHVSRVIAFHSGLEVLINDEPAATVESIHFAREHEPEARAITFIHPEKRILRITLRAFTDAGICEGEFTKAKLKSGSGPKLDVTLLSTEKDADDEADLDELEFIPSPKKACYFILDQAELQPLSLSAHVTRVGTDKIRYLPGETLKGHADIESSGGGQAEGRLTLFLEHGLNVREKVREVPVKFTGTHHSEFEFKLPARELGHALVAVFTSEDGKDRSEAAEYFSVTSNLFRVAIHGGLGGYRDGTHSVEKLRQTMSKLRSTYINCTELFAWAEEDMVEMSSQTDYWFSGQTNYHLSKQGLKDFIRVAHEFGYSAVTYGKFIMSGYLGWKTAYDYPNDHKSQYFYPVGMWEGTDVHLLDRFKAKEFVPYGYRPPVRGDHVFDTWWQNFMPINPDHTPRMVRIAAEEVIRSIEMFGWDAIRWDGHPRGGGQIGGAGEYNYKAARKTQALVRYFKDIVAERYPDFRYGYNYLLVTDQPRYDWALEDFELDELCSRGGLLMNESIGNTTAGKPFDYIARNLQVEGDLCRERGGLYLGISYAKSDRDRIIESALWFAAGCRPMGGASEIPAINRYGTRYSCYTLDETLRRIAMPEAILKPQSTTSLWWQPFVYETAKEGERSQLVVNLFNIPRQALRADENDAPRWDMPAGTEPTEMQLALPQGYTITAAHFIHPFSLEVTPAILKDGSVSIPSVAMWKVLILDLQSAQDQPTLHSLYGPPATFGIERKNLAVERTPRLVLKTQDTVASATGEFENYSGGGEHLKEVESFAKLSWEDRNQALLERKSKNKPENYINGWWKGGTLPHDLKLKDNTPNFSDLTPKRNGVLDVFYGRGAMDYRLGMNEVLAGYDRFQIHDAPLGGNFRAGGGHYLMSGVPWKQYSEFDLLLYTGIPHCAIGVENSYALVDYVKAGGAVMLTGGEYAFGKGGYEFTILERELLPVLSTETVDTRYSRQPKAFEPGKDFSELKVNLDFRARPSYWVFNQVALKSDDSVRVFLKSGNRPILVGWELGKGRVACLLVDHRGMSEDGVTAFFDWKDWPTLMRSVIAWLVQDNWREIGEGKTGLTAGELTKVKEKLESTMFEDGLNVDVENNDADAGLTGLALPGGGGVSARKLPKEEMAKRMAAIQLALKGSGPELALVLADQLSSVPDLPFETRNEIVDFARRNLTPKLEEPANRCAQHAESSVRSCGHLLWAALGSPRFVEELNSKPGPTETQPILRERFLAFGLAWYPRADLLRKGEGLVTEWNTKEAALKKNWTGGAEFSLGAPALPLLDAESLFKRVAWLGYLSRHDPKKWAAQLALEWLRTAQYQDDCDRSIGNLWGRNMTAKQKERGIVVSREWQELRVMFGLLRNVFEPQIRKLTRSESASVAKGFTEAHYTLEERLCINFLGQFTVEESREILGVLQDAKSPVLRHFSKGRLTIGSE